MLRKPTLWIALTLALLALAGPVSAADPGRTIDVKLTPRGFWTVFGVGGQLMLSIPRFHLYDKEGRRILDLTGYEENFPATLQKAVGPRAGAAKGGTLSEEIALVRKADGSALKTADLGTADFIAVEYWADWCLPCKKQRKEFDAFRQAHPEVHLSLVSVEADLQKADPKEMNEARKWAPSSPAPH